MPEPTRFVALDRDGTIIVERHYLSDPNQVELLPNAVAGMRRMLELGLGLVVLTNQAQIGRGKLRERQLQRIHLRMTKLLAQAGVQLSGIYHCPHAPSAACDCRKPLPALLERAGRVHGFRVTDSFVVGDKWSDIELGQRVGATTLRVRTGYGSRPEQAAKATANFVVDDLLSASAVIEHQLQTDQPVAQRTFT